ncbi:MAG: polymer-forming cytoskeletal protein [Campylobacteraceae bacterium]
MGFITKSVSADDKQNSETTVIASGASLNGNFDVTSILHIHGTLNGTLKSTNTVIICKTGKVIGDLFAKRVIINGIFEGNIDCESIEILEGGSVRGVLVYDSLAIEQKAIFEGQSIKKRVQKEVELKEE